MNKNMIISIIVPVYNAEIYLNRCICSILNQKYRNFELILVDDGSIDKSLDICNKFAKCDNRIKIIHQDNGGVSAARNRGIKEAIGEFIVFVDADDYVKDNYIQTLIEYQQKYETKFICGSYCMDKKFGRKKCKIYSEQYFEKELFTSKFLDSFKHIANAPWGKLFSRKIIVENSILFPEGIPYAEDSIFCIEYLKYIDNAMVISEVIYHYNCTDGNIAMRKYYKDICNYLYTVLQKKEELYNKRGLLLEFENLKIKEQQYYFNWCLKHYIEHISDKQELHLCISKSAGLFMEKHSDREFVFLKFIEEQDWDGLIKEWMKLNYPEYIKYKIKSSLGI